MDSFRMGGAPLPRGGSFPFMKRPDKRIGILITKQVCGFVQFERGLPQVVLRHFVARLFHQGVKRSPFIEQLPLQCSGAHPQRFKIPFACSLRDLFVRCCFSSASNCGAIASRRSALCVMNGWSRSSIRKKIRLCRAPNFTGHAKNLSYGTLFATERRSSTRTG